ncbi:cupin domain-containing protein [Pontibacterium sp. N1Y112]|uniref:Cupin domain-containing protein n=1 Tax=Pontibacterium sinense TaxID=2781979 RepID=A0A8J7FDU6_9GAMM|nr:cupin domain-containing protein [Pontibacterium sinense]MBE9398227.1 cupin domain-containing protein [Pontibacterium sinense]MCO4758373.1 cupin domain-containing protein [Oceanospirillaceae bacterium]
MTPSYIDQVVNFDDHPAPLGAFVTPPDRLLKGDPKQGIVNYVEELDGKFIAGLWESEPGKWKAVPGRREFCYIISGDVIISDAKGGQKRYKAGDSFMLPYGFDGYWEVLETCQKYYVILQD